MLASAFPSPLLAFSADDPNDGKKKTLQKYLSRMRQEILIEQFHTSFPGVYAIWVLNDSHP